MSALPAGHYLFKVDSIGRQRFSQAGHRIVPVTVQLDGTNRTDIWWLTDAHSARYKELGLTHITEAQKLIGRKFVIPISTEVYTGHSESHTINVLGDAIVEVLP